MMHPLRGIDVARPQTKAEVLHLLAEAGAEGRVLAGGTDLLVELKHGLATARLLVSLSRVRELRYLERPAGGGLRIGARATVRVLQRVVADGGAGAYRALDDACRDFASVQIRNMATVLGNLAHASPSAEFAPPLIALKATAVIAGPRAGCEVPLEGFFTGPRRTSLAPDELLAEVRVPAPLPRTGSSYQKMKVRELMDIAIVGVAAAIRLDASGRCAEARVVLGAVAPVPRRAPGAEAVLEGEILTEALAAEAARRAVDAASPIDDVRASAEYRRLLVEELTRRALAAALADARR